MILSLPWRPGQTSGMNVGQTCSAPSECSWIQNCSSHQGEALSVFHLPRHSTDAEGDLRQCLHQKAHLFNVPEVFFLVALLLPESGVLACLLGTFQVEKVSVSRQLHAIACCRDKCTIG